MHSYTSNSDLHLPNGNWIRNIVVSVIITSIILLFCELWLRYCGFVPSVDDNHNLWCYTRDKIKGGDPNEVVFLGASRIELGLNPDIFHKIYGRKKPVILAIDGNPDCRPVLDELSKNDNFCGTVIIDYYDALLLKSSEDYDLNRIYAKEYLSWNIFKNLDQWLKLIVESNIACVNTYNLREAFRSIIFLRKPRQSFITIRSDRYKMADYTKVNLLDAISYRYKDILRTMDYYSKMLEPEKQIKALNIIIDRIKSHGGKVAFIYMPISGKVKEVTEKCVPRKLFWDLMAKKTNAIMINYEDNILLSNYTCPEGSHLDFRDAEKFTYAFANILKQKL